MAGRIKEKKAPSRRGLDCSNVELATQGAAVAGAAGMCMVRTIVASTTP